MIRYFKNFILCGDIDYVCLLCEESFETTEDVEKHIRWEKHRKLIKTQEYFGKLKKDCVFKVGNKYYCEICNCIATKLDIIKKHVKEESHKIKKAKPEDETTEPIVKRELGFIKVPKYTLNKKEWHGILNKQCMLCDIDDIIDFDAHIGLSDHLINFIQTKVKVTEDGETYRKINEETFYCFKCKKLYPQEDMEAHWGGEEHNRSGKDIGFRPNEMFQVDREHNLVTCNVCQQTMEWAYLQMYDHRTTHIMNKEWPNTDPNKEYAFILVKFQDKGKLRSDLKKYGKDNFIKLNEGGSKGYCSLCNSYISAHMSNFRQHVQGLRHISHLELKGLLKKTRKTEKQHYRTKPFSLFYKEHVLHIKSGNVYIINDDLCIDTMSFLLLKSLHHNHKIVCFVCDGIYTKLEEHLRTESHKEKLLKTEVITSLKEEFVREVRPGLYHCGICNTIFAGYPVLEKHLNTIKHKLEKIEAKKMIEECIMENVDNCFCPSNIRSHFLDFLDRQSEVS